MSGLFGSPRTPTPVPPPPDIGDAAEEAAAREEKYRMKRKFGVSDTMLTSGSLGAGDTTKRTSLG